MSNVFVVDTNKKPLNTVHPGEARLLLNRGKAAVLKRYPFTIILKVAIDDPVVADLRIKIDPGSKKVFDCGHHAVLQQGGHGHGTVIIPMCS